MKKQLFFLYIIPLYLYSSFTFIGPYQPPQSAPKLEALPLTISPNIIINAGPTLSWWRCPERIILDVSSNKDFIKNNKSAVVPGFSFSLKRKFWQSYRPISVYIGFKTNFAKHKNATKTDYFDHDETQASLEIHQDIKSIRVAPFFEGVLEHERFSLSAWIAPTIGIKTVDRYKFRWWEKSTKSYTGQSLDPYTQNATGEFGTTLLFGGSKSGRKKRLFSFGYSFLLGSVTLKKRVIHTTPDPNASQVFHDQILLSDVNSIYLPVEPKIRYHAHVVRFGFAISF